MAVPAFVAAMATGCRSTPAEPGRSEATAVAAGSSTGPAVAASGNVVPLRAAAVPSALPVAPASDGTVPRLGCEAGRIVFTSERDGNRELYAVCPDGRNLTRLTSDPADDHLASVAPDGTFAVVRTRGHGGDPDYAEEILVGPADSLRSLAGARRRLRNPSFAPHARSLVVESDLAGFSDLFRVHLDGRRAPLTHDPAGSFEPAVSPDGRAIAFVSSRDGDAEIYRMTSEGNDLLRLTRSRGDDVAPTWSPDGRQLAFTSTRRGAVKVHVMNADGSRPRSLDELDVIGESELAWSPDGTRIAYVVTRREGSSLRVVAVDGGAASFEDGGAFHDETPAFSPDGRWLVFASDREGDVELYLAPSSGGFVVRLTRSPGVDFLPRWLRPTPR